MSDIRELQGYAVYITLEVFCHLANHNHGHIRVMLESTVNFKVATV